MFCLIKAIHLTRTLYCALVDIAIWFTRARERLGSVHLRTLHYHPPGVIKTITTCYKWKPKMKGYGLGTTTRTQTYLFN